MEKSKIALGVAGGLAVIGLVVLLRKPSGGETPPPGGLTCPYCGQTFATDALLLAHVKAVHSLECLVDSDCPDDFACVDGQCIPR